MGGDGDDPAQAASAKTTGLGGDLAAGFITSAVYTSLTYPVHRVKVLIQTQDANPRILSGESESSLTVLTCAEQSVLAHRV
jgi:solute carrier family 25 (adenine nucleotide translocator) protein 4/5/6/31